MNIFKISLNFPCLPQIFQKSVLFTGFTATLGTLYVINDDDDKYYFLITDTMISQRNYQIKCYLHYHNYIHLDSSEHHPNNKLLLVKDNNHIVHLKVYNTCFQMGTQKLHLDIPHFVLLIFHQNALKPISSHFLLCKNLRSKIKNLLKNVKPLKISLTIIKSIPLYINQLNKKINKQQKTLNCFTDKQLQD